MKNTNDRLYQEALDRQKTEREAAPDSFASRTAAALETDEEQDARLDREADFYEMND